MFCRPSGSCSPGVSGAGGACCSPVRLLALAALAGAVMYAAGHLAGSSLHAATPNLTNAAPEDAPVVLDHKVKRLNGAEADLSEYRGKVVLIVNVASKCGYTHQYEPLQKVYDTYKKDGLVVLAFPCNQFGGQEPGAPAEIAAFCEKNYAVEFPLMGKVAVKDTKQEQAIPLYKELTAKGATGDPGPVKWNFEKFLVGRDGKPIARFRSRVDPESKEMVEAIEKALAEKAPEPADDAKTAEAGA